MSKLLAPGLLLEEIIPRVTAARPGVLARRPAAWTGSLGLGAAGDLAILEVLQGRCTFRDLATSLQAERASWPGPPSARAPAVARPPGA